MITTRNAAMPLRKSPWDPRMLLKVSVAFAGSTRVRRTPNSAKGASTAMTSSPSPAINATLRGETSTDLAPLGSLTVVIVPLVGVMGGPFLYTGRDWHPAELRFLWAQTAVCLGKIHTNDDFEVLDLLHLQSPYECRRDTCGRVAG